jgi:hypothetical protein
MANIIIIYGNNNKNHEMELNPFLHNHPNIKLQTIANTSFTNTNKKANPLKSKYNAEITAMAKYILAGVHKFLTSSII